MLQPRTAVLWAAFFNFVAMFLFAPKVADTVSKIVHIKASDPAYVYVILAGLIGAIVWDLLTWWWGLPTSSSHALIGAFAGAGVAHAGWGALQLGQARRDHQVHLHRAGARLRARLSVDADGLLALPQLAAGEVDKRFRRAQLVSAALYSLGHGGNDAQKTMGIIMAVLIAGGIIPRETKLSLFNGKTSGSSCRATRRWASAPRSAAGASCGRWA